MAQTPFLRKKKRLKRAKTQDLVEIMNVIKSNSTRVFFWATPLFLHRPLQDVHDIYTTVLRACLPGLRQMVLTSTARWRFSEVEPRELLTLF